MKLSYTKVLAFSAVLLAGTSCDDGGEGASRIDTTLNSAVLTDFSSTIAQSTYSDLSSKTATLYNQVLELAKDGASDAELEACRTTWKAARQSWELSESFLFGPVSTDNIDPRIDTWPVNFNDLDAQLNSDAQFTEAYINNLEDALKGFHPIEYLIFGESGTKTAAQLSARDIEYLKGLALNLKSLTSDLNDSWDPNNSGNYTTVFTTAGDGSATDPTQLSAFEEMVNAMTGICDEVANGKIGEVYTAQDAKLEESPFAKNSITDFTNNIKGVQNVYLGKYSADGKGLEDMVRAYNLQLDGDIKLKMSTAVESLNKITVPFGEAISTQKTQVQNAIDAINALKTTLEEDLLPFVQAHAK